MICYKSAVAITNMIMAAACYPEAQRQVQEELDMVFEKDRSLDAWTDPLIAVNV